MDRSITISIPGVPDVALRKNRGNTVWQQRMSATKRMKESAYWRIYEACQGDRSWHFERFIVFVTQYYCGKPLDVEGLCSGCGPYLDAFKDYGIITDDEPVKYLEDWRPQWIQVQHRDQARVEITVTEAE